MKKLLRHPIVLIFISAVLIWVVQQCVLTNIARTEKRLDRKYEVLTEISSIYVDYYQEFWNYFFAKEKKEAVGNIKEYRARIQSISTKANALRVELPILFKNKEISTNWNDYLTTYHRAWDKLNSDELTEKELNKMLDEAKPYIDKIIHNISSELKQDNEWWVFY